MIPQRIALRLDVENMDQNMSEIESQFKRVFPGEVFNWYFLDSHMSNVYHQEKISRNQIAMFTMLAIVISCLGLLGMISTKVEEKIKEIGIRKVLGAGVKQIGSVLLKTTVRHVIAAILLGLPLAYYLGQHHLEHYSVRIVLQWWHYVMTVMLLVAIMFATIAPLLWKASGVIRWRH